MKKAVLTLILLMSSLITVQIYAQPQSKADQKIKAALSKAVGQTGLTRFQSRMLEEIKDSPVLYRTLVSEGTGLKSRVETLLVMEVNRAVDSVKYPLELLPGLRIFVRSIEGTPLEKKLKENAQKILGDRIVSAAEQDPTVFDGNELALSASTYDEKAKIAFALLKQNSSDPVGKQIFRSLTKEFLPNHHFAGAQKPLEIVSSILSNYPKAWKNHSGQGYLLDFWLKFNDFYRFFPNLSSLALLKIADWVQDLPARERAYLAILAEYRQDQSLLKDGQMERMDYFLRYTNSGESMFGKTSTIANLDPHLETLKGLKISLSQQATPGDFRKFVAERGKLMNAGIRAPIGATLFEKAIKENPELAKAIAPGYLIQDFWPLLLYGIDGHPAIRGTPEFLFMGTNKQTRNQNKEFTKSSIPYDHDNVNRVAAYLADSTDPALNTAKQTLLKEAFSIPRMKRWIVAQSQAFHLLFPKGHPVRARVDFLNIAEDGIEALATAEAKADAKVYLTELLKSGNFSQEYLEERYLRKALAAMNWSEIVDLASPLLNEFEVLMNRYTLSSGDHLTASITYANILSAHVQFNRPSSTEIGSRALRVMEMFQDDLKFLSKKETYNAMDTFLSLFGDELVAHKDSAQTMAKTFNKFKIWMELVAAKHDFLHHPDFAGQIQSFQTMFDKQFPDMACAILLSRGSKKIPELRNHFRFSGN